MNICLACREVVVDLHGGLPRATRDLASALAQAGHRVTLLTDLSPAPVPSLDGVDVVRVRLDDVGAAFPHAAPESAPHNLLHAAAVWREVNRRHVRDAPVDAVLAPLWRSEGAVCVLDRRWPTVVSCMTSLQTLAELDSGYLALADLEQRLALERAALRRSPYLHGLTHAVLDKTIADYGLAPQATAVIGRFEPDAVAHEMAAFFARVRSYGVIRPRLPWRRPRHGLERRLTDLIEDGLGLDAPAAQTAARRLLGLREPRRLAVVGGPITRRLGGARTKLLGSSSRPS